MTDLVQKLRSTADGDCREVARDMCFQQQDGEEWADLMDQAADEIGLLRRAVVKYGDCSRMLAEEDIEILNAIEAAFEHFPNEQ